MSRREWRHELKYEITVSEYLSLRHVVSSIMKPDKNYPNGSYMITSLYFDDYKNTALSDKIFGINEREKFRIRMYNRDTSFIRLEKKEKKNNQCRKTSAVITKEQVEALLNHEKWLYDDSPALMVEFYAKMKGKLLRPKTVVTYTRDAYTFSAGNVRVTFDHDLRTSLHATDFLEDDFSAPAVRPDTVILEIKYDEYLPDIIRQNIQLGRPRVQAFSKYAACREFEY